MIVQEFKNIDELIEAILEPKSPQLPAITDATKTIFWQELPDLVNAWLQRAKDAGIDRQNPIILFGHKEAEYVVAIAACLVAGFVYIPVDKAFPEERINKISEIANASHFYRADLDTFVKNEQFDVGLQLKEKDLAYIMFTSGSTGEPKGVQIGRESVLQFINWLQSDFKFGKNPVFMNQARFSFDLSCYEVFGSLSHNGHILLGTEEEVNSFNIWSKTLHKHEVSIWVSTPSFAYRHILSKEFSQDFLPDIKKFVFCGEILPVRLVEIIKRRFPNAIILNTYGPTEATVATTLIEIGSKYLGAQVAELPVGMPAKNTRIDFVENNELVIVGENVMRGYLNREDLNSSKLFIDEKTGFRAFKTGDAGYKVIDGDKELIYCTGRLDSQIKLHGYRIELDEIEANLDTIEGVHKSIVLPLRKADASVLRILAFYICLPEAQAVDTEYLKNKLSLNLPEYMIPSEFVCLKDFPVNSNNKIDRNKILSNYLQAL